VFGRIFPVAGLLLALSASAEPAPAGFSPPRFVVIAVDPGRSGEVEATYAALVASGARVVERADRAGLDLPPDGVPASNARVDDVRAALIEARARLRELEVDRAGAALNHARALAMGLEAPEAHRELLAEVLLERATLLLAREAPDAAGDELRLVAALDPGRAELHPGLYPPNLVSAFAAVKAETPATSLLTVTPRPAGATLWVDGRPAAASTPLELPAGPHWVTVRAPGRVTLTREVRLTPARAQHLEPLAAVPDAAAARSAARDAVRAGGPGADLLTLTGADILLALAAGRTLVERDGRREQVRALPGQPLAAAALAALAPRPAPPPEVEPPPPKVDEAEIWWIAGGATAAAAVVSTVIGFGVWYLAKPDVDVAVPRPVVITCCSL
jgi:hypothetical protein